ncbi:ornithine cyclodeaminase family protein [Novosphingobium terrae]|uniref:ornithine cyclodeaminase family protein n=1 Tax=Novosphingobium terrae TaxID=2726189 RepID=UPI00197D810D|nr:ornithine cyclodeaminase family protein [Novosphingobium terrae]
MPLTHYDADAVRTNLDYPGCIEQIAMAMRALSTHDKPQPLRSILPLEEGQLFALMPGQLSDGTGFGAKVISVFADQDNPSRSAHRGLVVLFAPGTGEVLCTGDAGEITHIRTAAASAVATRALARPDARHLTLFGCGAQARTHARAMVHVRPIEAITVWGRSPEAGQAFAARMSEELALPVRFESDGEAAARQADIICTVSSAATPILQGAWLQPGTHLNLVGSSFAGPVEVDHAAVLAGRYFVDSRASALAAAAEFLAARTAGLVDDTHIQGEIGAVIAGDAKGRQSAEEVTIYKSLGHIVQDLSALAYLHARSTGMTVA